MTVHCKLSGDQVKLQLKRKDAGDVSGKCFYMIFFSHAERFWQTGPDSFWSYWQRRCPSSVIYTGTRAVCRSRTRFMSTSIIRGTFGANRLLQFVASSESDISGTVYFLSVTMLTGCLTVCSNCSLFVLHPLSYCCQVVSAPVLRRGEAHLRGWHTQVWWRNALPA